MKSHCIALLAGLLAAGSLRAEDVAVTIRVRAPIQTLDADGHVSGVTMSKPGEAFIFVKIDGANLVLKDATGKQYMIDARSTDYTPPAAPATVAVVPATTNAAPTPAPATTAPPAPALAPATAAAPPAPTADAPAPNLSAADADSLRQLNDALGFPLLATDHLWNEPLDEVAHRLHWPKESATTTEASYRRYARTGFPIFGAPAYSMALYGKNGKPTYVSMIFSNAGDFDEGRDLGRNSPESIVEKVENDLAQAVKKDAASIGDKLTAILGAPQISLFGNSASNRDEVHRWDWKDVSFLLNAHAGKYASLKIIPASAADHFGSVEVADRDDLKETLSKRVIKRDNGDVVIGEIPMVDQGPKGYCVPATWERYLRYVDVPADLYVLAILGGTGYGGGTGINAMRAGVGDYVSAYHRRIEVLDDPLDVAHVSRYIDKGLPLMWSCFVTKLGEEEINQHTHARQSATDLAAYQATAATDDQERKKKEPFVEGTDNGHMRMIIGYNATTNELAISDSWGERAAERWITVQEAKDISQGDLEYIQW